MSHLPPLLALVLVVSLSPSARAQLLEVEQIHLDLSQQGQGFGLAADMEASTIVVGAENDDEVMAESGAVFVFRRNGVAWDLEQKVKAVAPGFEDLFGSSVALSGNTMLVGAAFDDDYGNNAGTVFAFERNGTTWTQTQMLVGGDTADFDGYGAALAIEGDIAVVGAPSNLAQTPLRTGAAYVFARSAGVWSLQQKLWPTDGATFDQFGSAVAVSGERVAVGAFLADPLGSGSGAVYVFVRSGTTWSLETKLFPSSGDAGDQFGRAIDFEGDTIVAGAPLDEELAVSVGAAFVFTRTGTTWSEQQRLLSPDGALSDEFGSSISISGQDLVVASPRHAHAQVRTGAAYLYHRTGSSWNLEQELLPVQSSPFDGGLFGTAIVIDGDTVMGSDPSDTLAGSPSGAVHVFRDEPDIGTAYCFGDGSGTACPCGNPGGAGEGCANSTGAGAILEAIGSPSIADEDFFLSATQTLPGGPGVFFQGLNQVNGGAGAPFGDGLRCAGGSVLRLQTVAADSWGSARTTVNLAVAGAATPGLALNYQYWYRDPATAGSCSAFNLSHATTVVWN